MQALARGPAVVRVAPFRQENGRPMKPLVAVESWMACVPIHVLFARPKDRLSQQKPGEEERPQEGQDEPRQNDHRAGMHSRRRSGVLGELTSLGTLMATLWD